MPGTITSDQLLVSACDATYGAPWADIGSFTTGPSIVDDYRIEGTNCNRARLSANVRGWSLCAMPGATLVYQYDAAPTPAWIDITTAFNNATTADTSPFLAGAGEAIGDQMQVGWTVPFGGLSIVASTLGTVGVVKWRYLNSAGTWTDLTGVTDGTTSFTAAGTQTVLWTMPTDWGRRSINGSAPLFWVCAEITTVYTINPVFTQGLLMYAPSNLEYCIYLWVNNAAPASSDTWANGGTRIAVTSDLTMALDAGTWPDKGPDNSKQWYLNGSDGLRQSGYVPYVVNPDATGSLTLDSPVLTRIRRVGLGVGSIAAMATGNFNWFWDACRIGTGLIITDGTSGSPADFASVLAVDHAIATMYGIITQASGVCYLGGKLYMGQASQTALTYFKDVGQVIVFRNFPVLTTFYEIRVVGASGFTSTFQLGAYVSGLTSGGCTVRGAARVNSADPSPTTSVWTLNGSDAYAVVKLYGSSFSELYRTTLNSASEVRSCTFKTFGDITPAGALFDSCTFLDLATASPISATYAVVMTTVSTFTNCLFVNCAPAMYWHVATNPNGYLDGTTFISGGTGHAIVLGTDCPVAITLTDVTFTGYGGTPGSNPTESSGSTDAAIYNNANKTITITIAGGTTPAVRNGSGATTVVQGSVPVSVEVVDEADDPIDNAQVAVYVGASEVVNKDSGTGGDDPGFATGTWTGATPSSATYRVRKSSTGTKYVATSGPATIAASSGMSVKVVLRVDPNA